MKTTNLRVADVARISNCHVNTVRSYVKKGFLNPTRDVNNFFRFTEQDAEKLKRLLEARWTDQAK